MIIAVIVCLILVPLAIAGLSLAPWVPTRKRDIERLCEILNMQEWQAFLEIGTGDGRVAEAVAKHFPKSNITGIELAFPMYIVACIRKYFFGVQNMLLRFWNAFKEDFWKYDVIYVYGMPDKMASKIVPQFLSQAEPWAKLYSYVFSIPEEYKDRVASYGGDWEAKIHVLEK